MVCADSSENRFHSSDPQVIKQEAFSEPPCNRGLPSSRDLEVLPLSPSPPNPPPSSTSLPHSPPATNLSRYPPFRAQRTLPATAVHPTPPDSAGPQPFFPLSTTGQLLKAGCRKRSHPPFFFLLNRKRVPLSLHPLFREFFVIQGLSPPPPFGWIFFHPLIFFLCPLLSPPQSSFSSVDLPPPSVFFFCYPPEPRPFFLGDWMTSPARGLVLEQAHTSFRRFSLSAFAPEAMFFLPPGSVPPQSGFVQRDFFFSPSPPPPLLGNCSGPLSRTTTSSYSTVHIVLGDIPPQFCCFSTPGRPSFFWFLFFVFQGAKSLPIVYLVPSCHPPQYPGTANQPFSFHTLLRTWIAVLIQFYPRRALFVCPFFFFFFSRTAGTVPLPPGVSPVLTETFRFPLVETPPSRVFIRFRASVLLSSDPRFLFEGFFPTTRPFFFSFFSPDCLTRSSSPVCCFFHLFSLSLFLGCTIALPCSFYGLSLIQIRILSGFLLLFLAVDVGATFFPYHFSCPIL